MRLIFCESTSDITFLISSKEVLELKRTKLYTPVLEAEDKGLVFHLMNVNSKRVITIKEPKQSYLHYWITINDRGYIDLIKDGNCGTRYGNSSKINIIVDNFL